jgi:hypothetical protein
LLKSSEIFFAPIDFDCAFHYPECSGKYPLHSGILHLRKIGTQSPGGGLASARVKLAGVAALRFAPPEKDPCCTFWC